MLCELCQLFPCTQFHPLQCPKLVTNIIVDKNVSLSDSDVYGTVEKQLIYVKIYEQFWKLREKTIEDIKKQKSSATT